MLPQIKTILYTTALGGHTLPVFRFALGLARQHSARIVLLHVVDSASPNRDRQIEEVEKVLKEIGAEQVPQFRVMNKIDLTEAEPHVARDEYGKIAAVWLSARTGAGIDLLRGALAELARSIRDTAAKPAEPLPTFMETDLDGLERPPMG